MYQLVWRVSSEFQEEAGCWQDWDHTQQAYHIKVFLEGHTEPMENLTNRLLYNSNGYYINLSKIGDKN